VEPSSRLRSLERIALRIGDDEVAKDARDLASRVEEGRFHVACVGQFKRGKSTLLNAIIGAPVLPMGVAPVTSAITVLRHGDEPAARVTFEDGRTQEIAVDDVGAYASESENPENRKRVRAVEVFFPSRLLARGLCLVDTPGLGSPLGANTAVTRAFVPHVDAALVVLGSDPPLSGEELDLVAEVAAEVRHLLFALNKSDRLSEEERREGSRFAAEMLARRLRRPVGPLLEVSARERLDRGEATRDWNELERTLAALEHEAGADIVQAAEARGAERLVAALLQELDERRDALLRPLAESEARLASLRSSVEGAERAMGDLSVLLAAESAKLAKSFRERHEAFFPAAQEEARRRLAEGAHALACRRTKLRAETFRVAQEAMRSVTGRFRAELEPATEERYRRAMERFIALGNEFLARLAASGEPGLDALPPALGPEAGLRLPSGLHYTELLYRTLSLTGWISDALFPRSWTLRSILRQTGRYLDDIIEANSSRVAADLADRVTKSRARLESELRENLHRVTSVAESALTRARTRRAEGEPAVNSELRSIALFRREVESLLRQTEGEGDR
jgi:GTP-binding protein EngB required for normal cell division